MLDWLIHTVVSGQAFFIGSGVLVLGVATDLALARQHDHIGRRVATYAALTGTFLVSVSSAPLPVWLYGLGVAMLLAYVALLWHPTWQGRNRVGVVLLAVAVVGVSFELPYHLRQPAAGRTQHEVFVLGDSISAGIGQPGVVPYPQLLHELRGIPVTNLAVSGCTVRGATAIAEQIDSDDGLVLLEIGGINLLNRDAAANLSRDLRALLDLVATPGRTVVMLELPLPPFMWGYGRVQRRLAREYGAILVPKHVMAGVLCSPGATDPDDRIHLTRQGQELMAERLWPWLRPSLNLRGHSVLAG